MMPETMGRLACVVVASVAMSGCARDEHRILVDHCSLGAERTLAVIDAPRIDGLVANAHWIVWSDSRGLQGSRDHGPPIVLGAPCDGGVAIAATDDVIACLRRARPDRDDSGHAIVYALEAAGPRVLHVHAGVGDASRGIAVARDGDAWVVAYQDADAARARVLLARGDEEPHVESARRIRGGDPALLATREGLAFAWVESWPSAEGRVEGRLMLRVGTARTRELEQLHFESATPTLGDDEGRITVTFRDRRPARARTKMYVRDTTPAGVAHEGVAANADGAASIVRCGAELLAVAPRRHARAERLVAVRRHDPLTLEGAGPEHEIYQHGIAYEYAAAVCSEGVLGVAVAARPSIESVHGSIRLVEMRCTEAP